MTNEEAMQLAYKVAANSKDPSSQNGSILLDSSSDKVCAGINRFMGDAKPERLERPLKYNHFACPGLICLGKAARSGVSTRGGTLVMVYGVPIKTAQLILISGIREIVLNKTVMSELIPHRWLREIDDSLGLLSEGKVKVSTIEAKLGTGLKLKINGKDWIP